MPTTEFVSSTDQGSELKVSEFIKSPTLVQSVMAKMLDKQFIADALLRDGGSAPGGVVKYTQDESMFAEGIEIVGEYGEIPVVRGLDGTPQAAFTRKAAGALLISEEMISRNAIDLVNKRLMQIKNAFVKFWDDSFMQAILSNPGGLIPTYAAPLAWTDTTAKIRFDIAKASELIMAQTDGNGNELGFEPDTLVLNPLRASAMTYNDDVAKVFRGNIADKAPIYVGDIGQEIQGIRILKSWRVPLTRGILLQRKTIGFISDERKLRTTPMYEIRERESWRSDTSRQSAVAIDAPKAAAFLTL